MARAAVRFRKLAYDSERHRLRMDKLKTVLMLIAVILGVQTKAEVVFLLASVLSQPG